MVTKNEQLGEMQRKGLDAAMQLAQLSIENSQRIMALQVETAKALFEESVKNAKALASVKDPREAMELRAEYARATTERMMATARQIAELTTEAHGQFGKMFGAHLTGGGKEMMEAWQKMFSFNPAAGQAAQTAMGSLQQAIDMARGAFEQMTKASTDALDTFGMGALKGGKRKG